MARKRSRKRVGIFIDAANIFYAVQTLGWKVDYKKFLGYWDKEGKVTGAYFYSAVISSKQKQIEFFKVIERIGFTVITREVKVIRTKRKIVQKGNFDVKLAIDIVLNARKFDIIVLASGDSDFEPVIEYLKTKRKKIYVVSARGHIAKELIKKADVYLPLEKIKKDIMKKESK